MAAVFARRSPGFSASLGLSVGHLQRHRGRGLCAVPKPPPRELDRPAHEGSKGDIVLSFGGSGLMLIWEAGVAAAFHSCPAFMSRVVRVLGTSGGACVGVLLLACPERIEEALEHYCKGALFRGATLADAVDPTVRLLPRFVQELDLLPSGAHATLAGRDGRRPALSVHMTPLSFPIRNVAFHEFANNEEVLSAVRASCCLNPRGVELRGDYYWDGGISDSLPISDDPSLDTITISPFSGRGVDVSPGIADASSPRAIKSRELIVRERQLAASHSPRRLGHWLRYNPTLHNARALVDAAIPQGRKPAERRFADGRRDGLAFLQHLGYASS